jgi:F-type H+-transporting ATPase subunit alpha
MDIARQVQIIFAVTNGYLDDVPVDAIKAWEHGFHDHLAANHGALAQEIATKKALSDDLTARLRQAIEAFKALHT